MERIQNAKEKRRLKIEKEIKNKKNEQERKEKKECTFNPKINKKIPSYIFEDNHINQNDNTYNYNNYNQKRRCNSVEKKYKQFIIHFLKIKFKCHTNNKRIMSQN